MYQLTAAGPGGLSRWLAEPSVRAGGYRDDFFLKVMAAARTGGPQILASVLANQRAYLRSALRDLLTMREGQDEAG